MNSGATADRVYDTLKRRLLSGAVAPGHKLEPGLLAEELMSSATPVRDALHRLIGEQLVEGRSGEGFFTPHVTEPDMRDLYAWSEQVLLLALRAQTRPPPPPHDILNIGTEDLASETAHLFALIAHGSANAEHRTAIRSSGDRLHIARIAEAHVFADVGAELDALRAGLLAGAAADLRKRVTAYHRRRQRATAAIVRAIYRDA